MVLKPSCGWCKDQDAFEVNEQLVALVSCFKKICELIHHSPIYSFIKEYDKETQGTKMPKCLTKCVMSLFASS